MKKRNIVILCLVVIGLLLQFVFSGHSYLAYCSYFLALLIFVFSKAGKKLKRIVCVVLALGIAYFAVIEVPIIKSAAGDGDFDADYLIVLGAGVNGTAPSLSLRERLTAAEEYLNEHPDTTAVVSGGKGNNEDISEAEVMERWLLEKGIAPSRIIKEDKATSTYENLKYSFELIGTDKKVAVISSEYHLYRTKLMADDMGLKIGLIPAHTTYPGMRINYFIREAFGVTYYYLTA